MRDFQVEFLESGIRVWGDFSEDSFAVCIPENCPERAELIDYYLYKRDIDEALHFLQCISADKPKEVNKALYISGLNYGLRGFKRSNARVGVPSISKNDYLTSFPGDADSLRMYEGLRDKHFMHDENAMTQAMSFIIVTPETDSHLGIEPAVVWNEAIQFYYQESVKLQMFLQNVLSYIVSKFDQVCEKIRHRYEDISIVEIEQFGKPECVLADMNSINSKR